MTEHKEEEIDDFWMREIDKKDAEITRLRAALEMFADPNNWETTYDDRLGPGETWLWSRPDHPLPIKLAKKALEGP